MVDFLKKKYTNLRFIGWFFLANTLVFWCLGYHYLKAILSSGSLFENSLANYSSFAGKIFVLIFTLVNYLSYMMLLAFIPATLLIIITVFISNERLVRSLSALVATICVVFLLIDSQIYSSFKFHINKTILSLIFSRNFRDVFDFSTQEMIVIFSQIGLVLVLEFFLSWFVFKNIIEPKRCYIGKTIMLIGMGGGLLSYFTLMLSIAHNNNLFSQQTPSLPLYNQILTYLIPDKNASEILLHYSEHHFSQPMYSNEKMNYPLHPLRCQSPTMPFNIILIMVDSLRFDSLQPTYMPNLTEFSQRSWRFLHQISGGNATLPGTFSLFYSIPSNYWTAALAQKKPPVFIDLLRKNNYFTRVIWSSEILNPPYDKTIYLGVDELHHNSGLDNDVGSRDRKVTQQAIQFLSKKNKKHPFFINLFYDAPHGFCRDQSYPVIFQPAPKECSRIALSNDMNPLPLLNRYLNAVHFTDQEIGKVLKTIEENGYLKNSVVIITSDHGQAFNDNHQNDWGHAGNFTDAQVHVPLIIHWPGKKPQAFEYSTSSYDLLPTLAEQLFNCQNPPSDYSIGQNLFDTKNRLPFVLVGSYVNMGIVESNRLTTLQASGPITITNPQAVPLPHAVPRTEVMHQVLKWMRMYFLT